MYPQIILLGDSLIQRCYDPETPGFGPGLQNAYFRRADVINRGFGGYNTEWLLPVLQHQIIPSVSNVILWIILIGANDAMLPEGPNHVPLDKFANNLLKMMNLIQDYHTTVGTPPRILLFSPPPIREELVAQYLPQQAGLRSREHTYTYARAVIDLPTPLYVVKLDLYESLELAPAQAYLEQPKQYEETDAVSSDFELGGMIMTLDDYLSDGLHLKNPSYKVMYTLAIEAIAKHWPEIAPEQMTMPVTWWGNLIPNGQPTQRVEL